MKNIIYSFLLVFALFLTGCADAGKNQTVNANSLVSLDGSASTPSVRGTITKYRWKQIRGKKVTLSNKSDISPTFTSPNVTKRARLVFRLTTKETGGVTSRPFKSRDYVAIIVKPNTDTTDTINPVITLLGETSVTLTIGNTYTDAGATASDNIDGDITASISVNSTVDITSEGSYTVTYNVSDAAGNNADTVTRTVIVEEPADEIAPIITMIGGDVTLLVGETYIEEGATAQDNIDGDITADIIISGSVDTSTEGNYAIAYNVSDTAGNVADEVSRLVTVNEDTQTMGVTLSGHILDINGTAISGATVTIGETFTSTNLNGNYTLDNIVASERVKVDVVHPNYLANSRIVPVGSDNIILDIRLGTAKVTLTFAASDGATVVQGDASVELPINGYIDANGSPYTGDVTVKMSYYPITTGSGRAAFPGTFEGMDGNETFPIQSYGFMNVELTDPQGNPLNLDGNSTATLTFPKDYNIYPQPTTMPLWHYDTEQGYWIEEGEASQVGYSSYVGTVTHFTSWNLDAKGPRAELTGCVEDVNGTKISTAQVQFSSINWDSYVVPTDENGSISVLNILAQSNLTFKAYKKIGTQWYYGEYPNTINLAVGENRVLPTCIVLAETNLPDGNIQVKGRITDFSNNPIPNASNVRLNNIPLTVDGNGNFDITIPVPDSLVNHVGDGECNTSFILQANKTLYNLGDIQTCLGGEFPS